MPLMAILGITIHDLERTAADIAVQQSAARDLQLKLTQGRALEWAKDTAKAVVIYEGLAAECTRCSVPYNRLAIIYRRAKQPADEERVVRLALANLTAANAQDWFVVRLAKIVAGQGLNR
jgi:hypothetical protein